MRIIVDRNRCTGQAMCESVAPDFFLVTGAGQVEIQVEEVPDARLDEAEWAVSCCPNQALEVEP
jgi:ferredoxin